MTTATDLHNTSPDPDQRSVAHTSIFETQSNLIIIIIIIIIIMISIFVKRHKVVTLEALDVYN